MHYLVITKRPQFTEAGEVVPGQCELQTGDWELRLAGNGLEESVIMTGTYRELRAIQRYCAGKTIEEIKAVAASPERAIEAAATASASAMAVEEDDVDMMGIEDVTQIMSTSDDEEKAEEGVAPPAGADAGSECVVFTEREGVKIASLRGESGRLDADVLFHAIARALDPETPGLVLDLGPLQGDAAVVSLLNDIADRARLRGCFFGIASADEALSRAIEQARLGAKLRLFPDVGSAVAAALKHEGT